MIIWKRVGQKKSQIVWTEPEPVKTVGCAKPLRAPVNLRTLPGSTTEARKIKILCLALPTLNLKESFRRFFVTQIRRFNETSRKIKYFFL